MPYQLKPGVTIDEIDTPALLLDLDAFEHNIARMAGFFADKPVSLRPHSKTHKCPQIALRQLEAGAIGITCAKVGEAEVMAGAGVQDILIANQIVGPCKIDRLTDLARDCDLMVAVDDADNVTALSHACRDKDVSLRVLVEVDVGMGRCGVQPGADAVALARQVAAAPGLRWMGLMGYEGHLVTLRDPIERAGRVREAMVGLALTYGMLRDEGLEVPIVSGGGTGTYDITGTCAPVTEVQAGSYVFMDTTYLPVRPEFEAALTVLSTVVSRPVPERIVTDAGIKTITREFGLPSPVNVEGLAVQSLSEEHGRLTAEHPEQVRLRPGDKLCLIPSHCCTTTNLYDRLHVVHKGKLVDIWPIAARGRAQ